MGRKDDPYPITSIEAMSYASAWIEGNSKRKENEGKEIKAIY